MQAVFSFCPAFEIFFTWKCFFGNRFGKEVEVCGIGCQFG